MGTKTKLKSISPPPPPHQKINNPPNFSVKEKETRNYAFFKAVHGSGTKRSRKNVLSV